MQSRNLLSVVHVEPDGEIRRQIATALRERFDVFPAATLSQAKEQIVVHRPAIILMELDLPDGDGMTLIAQVRSDPRAQRTIICCLTTRRGVRDKIRAFQAGAQDYLVKPVALDSFPYRLVLLLKAPPIQDWGGTTRSPF